MKKIVFFNNKAGVGKTTMVYHFSYMLAEIGHNVLCVDLDPQSNLTSMMVTEDRLEEIYEGTSQNKTILDAIKPLLKGIGDISIAHLEQITDRLNLLVGDLELSAFEDYLSENWGKCLDRNEYAFRVISSFHRIIESAASRSNADFVIIDVGPNLGAINRTSLITADHVVLPVAADLFSLQGIKNLGKSLNQWRVQWQERLSKNPEPTLSLPRGLMQPIGYVILQHGIKSNRIYKSYERFANRIPPAYHQFVLNENSADIHVEDDQQCLGMLKHYHSLMPMAMEARKPIFLLKPSDGAIGAHFQGVKKVYDDFKELTESILSRC